MINRNHFTMFILTLILGILLVVQVKILSKGIKYVPLENLKEATLEIEKYKAEIEQLSKELLDVNKKLNIYDNAQSDYKFIVQLKEEEIRLEELLHYTDVEGPGVIVIVSDATREAFEGEPLNNLLVHDGDIEMLVTDLRNSGAEAISVNGERIIFPTTKFICVGQTIKINGVHTSPPFIIKAIGNRKYLEAAINAPNTNAERIMNYGIFIEANTSISVEIDKYDEELEKYYMEIYKEGD